VIDVISTLDTSTPAALAKAASMFLRVDGLVKMTGSTLANEIPTSTVGVVGVEGVTGMVDGEGEESVFVSDALHAELDVLPETEIVPEGQVAQTVDSERSDDDAPDKAYLPAGQTIEPVQTLLERPVVEPYVPAGQLLQVALPERENVPTGHDKQVLPFELE